MKKSLTWAIILICYSTNIIAETTLTLSPTFLHFDYSEFDTNDNLLDRETGWLPGIEVKLAKTIKHEWQFDINTSYYQGTVDYKGETQQGLPHTTNTDEVLFRIGARAKKAIYKKIYFIFGAQSHRWERGINDKNNISGIDETYKWDEYAVGLNFNFNLTHKDTINLEANYLLIRNGTIFVDISKINLGTTTLDLEDEAGARLTFDWKRNLSNKFKYGVSFTFETWQFGRSNTKQTQNSSTIIFVTEPRSETRNIGLQFNIEYIF